HRCVRAWSMAALTRRAPSPRPLTLRWKTVFLETTDGLDASMSLYKKLGFTETRRAREALWTGEDVVITMTLPL
ncbi:MAG: hypothetical protein AAGJ87_09940, partial [Pseudomonadota bacterium]